MAQLPGSFNANQHEDMLSFGAFAAKNIPVQIVKSSLKDTHDKTGRYIELEFVVLSGKFKKRKIWRRLNVENRNDTAVEYAQRELATICRACGKVTIDDTQEIHGIPMMVDTDIEAQKGRPETTIITAYHKADGEMMSDGDDSDSDAPASGGKELPWNRKR